MKKNLCLAIMAAGMLMLSPTCKAQYDRAVVSLTRLNYVYYNIDNPISVAVPGLLPKDIVVSIGEDKAFLHRDPDGSNSNDLVVRPKDSTGTIMVHVDERISENKTRNRGMIQLKVVKLPNPTLYLGYVHEGDTISIDDLREKGYIRLKAAMDELNFELEEPEIISYTITRSEAFQLPIEVEGCNLTKEVREMLSKARRDETIYIDNVKVKLADERIVTLHAEFPLR